MKKIVGLATISMNKNSQMSFRVYLSKNLAKLVNSDVIFNWREMVMTRAIIDSINVHSTKNKSFSFLAKEGDSDNFVGTYNVIQKDEDTFKFKRTSKCPKIQSIS